MDRAATEMQREMPARPAQSKHGQLNHRRLWAGGGTNLISRPLLRITIKWASDAIIQSRVDRAKEEGGRAFTLKDNFRFNYIYFPSIADLEMNRVHSLYTLSNCN